jgi:hypothetical protein
VTNLQVCIMGVYSSTANLVSVRKPGEACPFYWACRDGNIAAVQNMLPNLTYEQVNQIEPNGSTALHAASYYNQPRIVRLLLESGCSRTVLNHHGATAYQEAATDEIRALFDRPRSKRFVDDHLTDSFQLVTHDGDNVEMKDGIPDDWFKGHTSADSAHEAQFMITMVNSSHPLKQIVKNRTETKSTETLSQLISTTVPDNNKDYKSMKDLHKKFLKKMGIGHLITMYTLETPLYTALQTQADSFTVLLYFHLDELQDRAFQGRTYRGGTMTQNDIKAYRWAFERQGHILETRTLQSTSLHKSEAKKFAILEGNDKNNVRYSVLIIFDFPQTCPTAINLTKISETVPALSAFEREAEVLLLPFTLFSVREIKIDSQSGQYCITLTNVPTPKASLLDAIKRIKE